MNHSNLRQPLLWSVVGHILVGTVVGGTVVTSDLGFRSVPARLGVRIVKLTEPGASETTPALHRVQPVVPEPSLVARSSTGVGFPVAGPNHSLPAAEPNVASLPGSEAIAQDPNPKQSLRADSSVEANAEGLREYRLNLGRAAAPYKNYPVAARDRGWEGVVVVQLRALPGTALPVVAIGRSSGHGALDEQALEMIRRAVEVAALPDSLRGHAFGLELPIQYSLRD